MSVLQYPGLSARDILTTSRLNYTVNSGFPSRKPRPSSLKGSKSFKKDIKDTVQHAALINIVAAVNENLHEPNVSRFSSGSSIRSNVTMITNFTIPHEKTVSIPQTKQRIFNMPDEIVQKKPVYYKHSKDLEVRSQANYRFYDENGTNYLRVKGNESSLKAKPTLKEFIKNLPSKPRILDINFKDPDKNKKPDDKQKTSSDQQKRVPSGVRRLGSVKTTEPRKVYELPKCDAVDMQDSHEDNVEKTHLVMDGSFKVQSPYTPTRIPYIRTKSLPVIFPTKTSNRASPALSLQQKYLKIRKDRPLSQSLREQTPDSMYKRMNHLPNGFCYDGMAINNGVNQAPDISGKIMHDSEKPTQARVPVRSSSKQKYDSNLRSPSTPTLGRRDANVFLTLQNDFSEQQDTKSEERVYKSKYVLHEAVRRAMVNQMENNKVAKANKTNRQVMSSRSRKSCLTSRSGISETLSGNRTPKKVQFLSSDSSLNSSETDSVDDEPNVHDIRGGSGIIQNTQAPMSVLRAYSPGIQPMSARELLRLEQKILPANTPPPPSDNLENYYATNSLFNVQHLLNTHDDKSKQTIDGNVESDYINEDQNDTHKQNENTEDTDNKGKAESDLNVTSDSNNADENNDDDDGDGFYKLVKAVEKQPYDGFEHKKMRRPSTGGSKSKENEKENRRAQYVKVKLS